MSKQDPIELIEYELTTFIRRAVYLDNSDRKIGHLERVCVFVITADWMNSDRRV